MEQQHQQQPQQQQHNEDEASVSSHHSTTAKSVVVESETPTPMMTPAAAPINVPPPPPPPPHPPKPQQQQPVIAAPPALSSHAGEKPPPAAAVRRGSGAVTGASSSVTVEQVRERLSGWLHTNKLTNEDTADLQALLRDYDSLKDKTGKLKSLLGRSAKAQREAKVDLDATQKRLDLALREIDRLSRKIDKLANRPTHMELLADFETNFDRAMLSVGQQHQQAGGQDTAQPLTTASGATTSTIASSEAMGHLSGMSNSAFNNDKDPETAIVDNLLMQELNESKQRIEKLEHLNAALLHRSSALEGEAKERKRERDELASRVSRLELEKRMAVMEAEHATKAMEEKAASLEEMQFEIDLVTKASVNANARAAHGEEMIKSVKTDKQHVQLLESKVQALQEWALASNEGKNLAQERVRMLESQLRTLQNQLHQQSGGGGAAGITNKKLTSGDSDDFGDDDDSPERILFSKEASLVVGAGDTGVRVFTLPDELVRAVKLSERVILRWQFDLIQDDATVEFSILKSGCDTPEARKHANYLIKDRTVTGGAAGETENAFAIQNSCTLLWSNAKSWIRPRTVKYTVEAVAVEY